MEEHNKVRNIASDLVFPSPSHPMKPWDCRSAWLSALKKAGIQDFRFHDLRHSCASYLAMNEPGLIFFLLFLTTLGHPLQLEEWKTQTKDNTMKRNIFNFSTIVIFGSFFISSEAICYQNMRQEALQKKSSELKKKTQKGKENEKGAAASPHSSH